MIYEPSISQHPGNQEDTLIIVPGWAMDPRPMIPYFAPYQCVVMSHYDPFYFADQLATVLAELKSPVAGFIGFSMGAMALLAAQEVIPDSLPITLVGLRARYPQTTIKAVRRYLAKDYTTYLTGFYTQCMGPLSVPSEISWDQPILSHDYLDHGLDYLAQVDIPSIHIDNQRVIRAVHGTEDLIAPLEELIELCGSQFPIHAVPNMGHLPGSGDLEFWNSGVTGWPLQIRSDAATDSETFFSN